MKVCTLLFTGMPIVYFGIKKMFQSISDRHHFVFFCPSNFELFFSLFLLLFLSFDLFSIFLYLSNFFIYLFRSGCEMRFKRV